MQDGVLSCNIETDYQYKKSDNKYNNIERSILIKSGDKEILIPKGTQITMVVKNGDVADYYQYTVKEAVSEVKLKEFRKIENNTEKYEKLEIKNINYKAEPIDSIGENYNYHEEFRFVIDFSNCIEYLEKNTPYNIFLKKTDDSKKIDELKTIADNVMIIQEKRNFIYEPQIEQVENKQNGNIKITGNVNANAVGENTDYEDLEKNLAVKVILKNSEGMQQNIPIGTILRVNGVENEIKTDNFIKELFKITKKEINENINIEFDMTNVLQEEQKLLEGIYTIELELYISKDNILQRKVGCKELDFRILGTTSDYAIKSTIIDLSEKSDKIQLFKNQKNKTLRIDVEKGSIEGANIKIRLQKRTGPFEYTDIENIVTANAITDMELKEVNNIEMNTYKLEEEMYRLIVELYDIYGNKYTEDRVNFYNEDVQE